MECLKEQSQCGQEHPWVKVICVDFYYHRVCPAKTNAEIEREKAQRKKDLAREMLLGLVIIALVCDDHFSAITDALQVAKFKAQG